MTPPAMHAERLAPVCFYLNRWMWLVSWLGERCQADIQMQCCPDVTACQLFTGASGELPDSYRIAARIDQ